VAALARCGGNQSQAARELDISGFRVEQLRLADGERVQVVLARKER